MVPHALSIVLQWVLLVEQLGGVVGELTDVLELFLLDKELVCPLNHLEWSSK
jgi:hypothetical protein